MLIFKKCIVPELLINLPLPFRLPCYSYLCCSLSLTLKVTISLTKSLALSLVWFISFLLLVAEHLSLILLVGGVWGTCLPLLRPPPHSQALGLANTSFWAGSLHSSLTPQRPSKHLQARKGYLKQTYIAYHFQDVQICDYSHELFFYDTLNSQCNHL